MTKLMLTIPPVESCRLLNFVRRRHNLESDGALSRAIGVQRADVSRIRNGHNGMGPALLLRIHEYTGVPALELRAIADNVNVSPNAARVPFECWSNDDGDSWGEHPADGEFVDGLNVGDTYELLAGWNSVRVIYRVTKAPDDESDDYEVECVSHPNDNVNL